MPVQVHVGVKCVCACVTVCVCEYALSQLNFSHLHFTPVRVKS